MKELIGEIIVFDRIIYLDTVFAPQSEECDTYIEREPTTDSTVWISGKENFSIRIDPREIQRRTNQFLRILS